MAPEVGVMKKGLVHIYTGDGKGKTTAAMGLLIRAAGQNMRVIAYQFLKAVPSGELKSLAKLDIPVRRAENASAKFTWDMTREELDVECELQQQLFDEACEDACSGEYDLVVLDEALGAVKAGMIKDAELLYLIQHKHKGTEIVLTGRDLSAALKNAAHYVTEMRPIKHPIDEGMQARRGIEY